MKISYSIIIVGIIVIILGSIFHFQGQGEVGPESSFMYANEDWISYGIGIAITGVVILIFGIIIRIRKP